MKRNSESLVQRKEKFTKIHTREASSRKRTELNGMKMMRSMRQEKKIQKKKGETQDEDGKKEMGTSMRRVDRTDREKR